MRFMMMYKPATDLESGPPSKEYVAEMGKLIEEGYRDGQAFPQSGRRW